MVGVLFVGAIITAASDGENSIATYAVCALIAIVSLSFAVRFPRAAWGWKRQNPGIPYPTRRKVGWAAAFVTIIIGSVAIDSSTHPENYEQPSARQDGADETIAAPPTEQTSVPAASTPDPTTVTTVSAPPADDPADLYDCAEPTMEVITFGWFHPSRELNASAPPGVLFARDEMRIRITNNSRHKISTSDGSFDMAWKSADGKVYISTEFMRPYLAWDNVPVQGSVLTTREETVRGHDAIEFKESFHSGIFATDGSEPWVNQSRIGWAFDSPEIRELCDEQFARLGRNVGPL